jgi:hypothetical protein
MRLLPTRVLLSSGRLSRLSLTHSLLLLLLFRLRHTLPALQIFPHGSTDALPFATMGSGSLNAMAVFEAGYKDDMTKAEAMELAARAIRRCGAGKGCKGVELTAVPSTALQHSCQGLCAA